MASSVSMAHPSNRSGLVWLFALVLAGLLGNHLHFSIFLDIEFFLGSIFAMLALQFFGLRRGTLAAALIASYTYFLSGEPSGMLIMTAEVAVVGWLMAQRKLGMVLADTLYWLFVGLPLAYLFSQWVLDVAPARAHLDMAKLAVNGIGNALLARLVFTGFALRSTSSQSSFRELIRNLLALFALCPALIMMSINGKTEHADQAALYVGYTNRLVVLLVLFLISLVLAELLSRRIIGTLQVLGKMTRHLPLRLATGDSTMVWPESGVAETTFLIDNFRMMSDLLKAQFDEVQRANETLEHRVDERTAELQLSHQRLERLIIEQKAMLENELIGIIRVANPTIIWANPAFEEMLGYEAGEMVGTSHATCFPDERSFHELTATAYPVMASGNIFRAQIEQLRKDGSHIWVDASGATLDRDSGESMWVFLDITEHRQAQEQVRQMAFLDPLTKLPNRRLIQDRLSQTMAASRRSGCYGAVMFLDLDNFKALNDSQGHEVGDLLLIEVAQRLRSCVREIDTIARIGGDEFIVMLSELDTDLAKARMQSQTVAEKVRTSLALPYRLTVKGDGESVVSIEHRCTSSIGVALFRGSEASQDEILKLADKAMYQAKSAGRNLVYFAPASA